VDYSLSSKHANVCFSFCCVEELLLRDGGVACADACLKIETDDGEGHRLKNRSPFDS